MSVFDTPRRVMSLAANWKFQFASDNSVGLESPAFDDSHWASIDLPHTWNAGDGTMKAYRRGAGWYRLRFSVPAETRGRRAYVHFSGVSLVATAWLNGRELGTHWGAHSAFRYDVTEALRADGENVLVVCANNTWREDVPPSEGDFTMFGGIHRGVFLFSTSTLAVNALDHAGPGIYLTTPEVDHERAKVSCRVSIFNAHQAPRSATLALTILDATGKLAASGRVGHAALPGVTQGDVEADLVRPRLWHGRIDPYLYEAVLDVESDGAVVDRVRQSLGIRSFRVDAQRGFILNGQPYELRGVNMHEDSEGKGSALSLADRERDFKLVLELGATFVRLVHYQHDQYDYDLADRMGLVVWAEHGLVNTVSESPNFAHRSAHQLRELIRQCHNHPSVVVWGIGNEVRAQSSPAAAALLSQLSALVEREDPSRPSALATCYDEVAGVYGVDLVAHNKYFGWYEGSFSEFAAWLDGQRSKDATLPLAMSEYGAGAAANMHSAEPVALDHSEEHQALFHEAYWRMLCDRPWLWCKAVWQMFDSASSSREEGARSGINDKGLVTRDRATRKDAFYWYKANWTDEPFVYITSRRFTPRTRATAEVKIYSNCDEVELRLNGSSRGVVRVDDCIARWPALKLDVGDNHLEVMGRRGDTQVSDGCDWFVTS